MPPLSCSYGCKCSVQCIHGGQVHEDLPEDYLKTKATEATALCNASMTAVATLLPSSLEFGQYALGICTFGSCDPQLPMLPLVRTSVVECGRA